MMKLSIINEKNAKLVSDNCLVASDFFSRLVGLLSTKEFHKNAGLLIENCKSVHTFFMRFAIDVVFLNKSNEVVAVYSNLVPWRMTWVHFRACSVLELPSGVAEEKFISVGDRLIMKRL